MSEEVMSGEAPLGEEASFEQLLEASLARLPSRMERGQRVRGRVLSVGLREALVDLGGKREALLDLGEPGPDGAPLHLSPGDELESTLVDEGDETTPARISAQVPGGRLGRVVLAEAKRQGRSVQGLVRGFNRGGLEIQVGALHAFCPTSQVDLRTPADLSAFVGQRLDFRVHDLKGRQVVLSRRALLEEARSGKVQERLAQLTEGQTLTGTVASLHDFGAFVDLGGVDALMPTAEVSRRRIGRAAEVLQVGQALEVKVLRLEPAAPGRRARLTVSRRALEPDPWEAATAWLTQGAAFRGKVVGLQAFGAFVELVPGVDGLIHVSDLAGGRHVESPGDLLELGQDLDVVVLQVDWETRRVSLAPLSELSATESLGLGDPEELKTSLGEALKNRH